MITGGFFCSNTRCHVKEICTQNMSLVRLFEIGYDFAFILVGRLLRMRRGCYHAMEMEIRSYATLQLHGRMFEWDIKRIGLINSQ